MLFCLFIYLFSSNNVGKIWIHAFLKCKVNTNSYFKLDSKQASIPIQVNINPYPLLPHHENEYICYFIYFLKEVGGALQLASMMSIHVAAENISMPLFFFNFNQRKVIQRYVFKRKQYLLLCSMSQKESSKQTDIQFYTWLLFNETILFITQGEVKVIR